MRKVLYRIIKVILVIIIVFLLYCYYITNYLIVSEYDIKTPLLREIRIVQITDLHNKRFGKNNKRLVALIKKQNPDFIVITGDMLNNTEDTTEVITELVSELSLFTQVYFGYGNHEVKWLRTHDVDLRALLEDAGATVVNNSYVDVDIKGQQIRIGGYMGYYHFQSMLTHDPEQLKLECDFTKDFEDTERYKILLNHIPTQWVDWRYVDSYNVDLVFSGHYHGGMIQIPFTEVGLIAPYVGWFPKNIQGVFEGERCSCILSTGLGSEYPVPRINNPPEIVVANLEPEEK